MRQDARVTDHAEQRIWERGLAIGLREPRALVELAEECARRLHTSAAVVLGEHNGFRLVAIVKYDVPTGKAFVVTALSVEANKPLSGIRDTAAFYRAKDLLREPTRRERERLQRIGLAWRV